MSGASLAEVRHSSVPWWIDPYSDNPIAFGLLFLLIVIAMIASMLIVRFLFIHVPGAQPIPPPYSVWNALARISGRL